MNLLKSNAAITEFYINSLSWEYVAANLDYLDPDLIDEFIPAYLQALKCKRKLRSFIKSPNLNDLSFLPRDNKIIWFFWMQGLQEAPESVRYSYQSWLKLNPDYQLIILTEKNVREYFPFWDALKLPSLCLKIAHKADFLRTFLVYAYGGIWVDATSFCFKPLADWLPPIIEENGVYFPRQPNHISDRLIKNWLVASKPKNILIKKILTKLSNYIFESRQSPLSMRWPPEYLPKKSIRKSCKPTDFNLKTLKSYAREQFYPYFFYHYIYNDIVLHSGKSSKIRSMCNAISEYPDITPGSKTSEINSSIFVTKQSYREHHLNSEMYKLRLAELSKLIDFD